MVLIDVITKDDSQIRNLPKIARVIIVLLLPIVGSIVWALAGRTWPDMSSYAPPASSTPALTPRSTKDELAALDAEIAFHEKQARVARLEAELAKKRKRDGG